MSRRRRSPSQPKTATPSGFWGRPGEEPKPVEAIRPTPDPSAVPRSLGDPPLAGGAATAQHHLAVVYQEAVRAATALAAANGLLDLETLTD